MMAIGSKAMAANNDIVCKQAALEAVDVGGFTKSYREISLVSVQYRGVIVVPLLKPPSRIE
jgi:hypothetical protein